MAWTLVVGDRPVNGPAGKRSAEALIDQRFDDSPFLYTADVLRPAPCANAARHWPSTPLLKGSSKTMLYGGRMLASPNGKHYHELVLWC